MGLFWRSSGAKSTESGTSQKSAEEAQTSIEIKDPRLAEFYNTAAPPTPAALKEAQKQANVGKGPSKTATTDYEPQRRTLKIAARDNCVEYESALSDCLLRGTYWERVMSCKAQMDARNTCNELQEYALKVLGYEAASMEKERLGIAHRADDLMIKYCPRLTITPEEETSFKTAIDTAAVSRSH